MAAAIGALTAVGYGKAAPHPGWVCPESELSWLPAASGYPRWVVARAAGIAEPNREYTLPMAMEYAVQRLEMGDVVLIDLPEQEGQVEAKVLRPIDRTDTTVRALLRVAGREDFVEEWPLGEMVTVVRGP